MQPYVKIYLDYFDFKTESEVFCEACMKPAQDIHHVYGRGEGRDVIRNLMALCRKCHDKAHNGKVTKSELQLIHNFFLSGRREVFLK